MPRVVSAGFSPVTREALPVAHHPAAEILPCTAGFERYLSGASAMPNRRLATIDQPRPRRIGAHAEAPPPITQILRLHFPHGLDAWHGLMHNRA